MGYGIGRKNLLIWVSVSDRNQNSGFGRSLLGSLLLEFCLLSSSKFIDCVTTFSAIILCNLNEDFCGWENVQDSPDHKWERKTVEELSGESRAGPDTTFDGDLANHFAIAGNIGDSADEGFASLKSPFFESFEHPVECFSFWFYFGVKSNSNIKIII